MSKVSNVDEYIVSMPKNTQKKLMQMRKCIKLAAPKASESLKWGIPAYSYKRILVMFAGFKNHIGFYPTPNAISASRKNFQPTIHRKALYNFLTTDHYLFH